MLQLFLPLLFLPLITFARVDVAFIEVRNAKNQIVRLEPNGQFAHLAVSYKGQWLHAYPYQGVTLVPPSALEKIGRIKAVISLNQLSDLKPNVVKYFLGRNYDSDFSWDDEKVYCSELVAKLIGLAPRPMWFDPTLWPPRYQRLNGQLGISPDEIYRRLKQ